MLVISIAEEFSIIAQLELVRLKLYYRTLKSIIGINVSYFCQMDISFFFFFCSQKKNCRDTTYDVTRFDSDVDNSYESII